MGTNGYSFRTFKLCPKVEEKVSREMEKEVGDNEQTAIPSSGET
jgi:hypothetical protein